MTTHIRLEDENGQRVALTSVALEGRLEGLRLTMKVSKHYVNASPQTIEASYTFPAGWGSQLLGLHVTLHGKRMQAVALAKRLAEERYEEAVADGDTPVMLEKSELGLYTANLGNLKPGEEALIELEYAQLLRFEKGRLRITVPTVLAERYGDPVTQGHVQAHQGVHHDAQVSYPFHAFIDVLGQAGAGVLSCPSHPVTVRAIDNGQRVELQAGAAMDRDFVLVIDALEGASFACLAADDDGFAAMASFCPKLTEEAAKSVALKILVDCSGSMEGESIAQAREALHQLSQGLNEHDMMSFSKFGTQVRHTTNQLSLATPQHLREVFAPAIAKTRADMGGTELGAALHSTFKLSFAKAYTEGCDLLLITDGDVWDIEDIVRQAKLSQHRIFAIGVGSAPAESLLRDLAEQTGGACELVTPRESMAHAVMRMLHRMRAQRTVQLHITWGADVLWQSVLPKQAFSEETLHVFAQLKSKPEHPPQLTWTADGVTGTASAPAFDWDSSTHTARMTAGAKLATLVDDAQARDLAVKYQLASSHTNLLLVHVRDDNDKATGLPTLQTIPHMQAAGWGGLVNEHNVKLSASRHSKMKFGISAQSVVYRTHSASTASFSANDMSDFELPAFLRTSEDGVLGDMMAKFLPPNEDNFSPTDMLEAFNALAVKTTDFEHITWELMGHVAKGYVWEVLCNAAGEHGNTAAYWACLLNWLSRTVPHVVALERHAQRHLNAELAKLDVDQQQAAEALFAASFPGIAAGSWGQTPAKEKQSLGRRLKKILTGA